MCVRVRSCAPARVCTYINNLHTTTICTVVVYVSPLQNVVTVISACSVTAHVTVALAAVTRRPDTVLVDVQLVGRVTTVKMVGVTVVL